jgi:hypothetical protein
MLFPFFGAFCDGTANAAAPGRGNLRGAKMQRQRAKFFEGSVDGC